MIEDTNGNNLQKRQYIKNISAQVSTYPLRQASLSLVIDTVLDIFRKYDLELLSGPMSTIISGEECTVWKSLQEAFNAAAEQGDTVMNVTISNACPVFSALESQKER